MKRSAKLISILLALAMILSIAACGKKVSQEPQPELQPEQIPEEPQSAPVRIDETGLATWEPVEGAVEYEYDIVDKDYCSMGTEYTAGTAVQLPEGCSIHLRAVFADGSFGDWITSDFYGEPGTWPQEELDPDTAGEAPSEEENIGAVQQEMTVTLDADGYAAWEPVDGAVAYRYAMLSTEGSATREGTTDSTEIRVLKDHCVQVSALDGGGEVLRWGQSAYNGREPLDIEVSRLVDIRFAVEWENVKSWSLMENLRFDTLQTAKDGSLTFTATAPDGSDMRFVTTPGVTVTEGEIRLEPMSRVYALDAIGRICAYRPVVSDAGEQGELFFSGGYSFDGRRSVDNPEELFKVWGLQISTQTALDEHYDGAPMLQFQPNMVGFGAAGGYGQSGYALSDFVVFYDEATYATPIQELQIPFSRYGTYFEGDLYDPAREIYDPEAEIYTFYLLAMPQLLDEVNPNKADILIDDMPYMSRAVQDIPMEQISIGQLKNADGKVLDKATDPLSPGCTLEVTIAGSTYDMELPVLSRYRGAQTLHELTPYANGFSQGDVTALVIPVRYPDLPQEATDTLLQELRTKLGRVVDEAGNSDDGSADLSQGWSLSAYYDNVSAGAYRIESFLTDWIDAPYPFAEVANAAVSSHTMSDELIVLVRERYPDLDWSRFDRNGDGILDAVIFFSACGEQGFSVNSYGGGVRAGRGYDGNRAGTPERPNLKDFIAVGSGMLAASPNVLIHEYGHNLGLVDYYDVTYSGIDAVGMFDMQSQSMGDWNAFSKYAVGWIEPEVVTDLAPGQSVEFTIGTQSKTGDAIVIPAAGAEFDGPFGEYILVDLFAADGVNEYDAAQLGLEGVSGVRIYHVNAAMEYRELEDLYGDICPIGTVRVANDYKESGTYLIELLQKGGINTFTNPKNLRTMLSQQDLFTAGDSFEAENYSQFLSGGRMDDGSEFGYRIDIVSVKNGTATVRITRK